METQKFRINRNLTGTTWTIPCTGTTNVWPMNTSTNCKDIPVKNSTCKDIHNYINGNTNDFPNDLKECSPTTPCIILWDCVLSSTYNIPLPITVKCSNLEGYNYVKFSGLRVTYMGIPVQDNFTEVKKVMSIARNNNITLVPTVTKLDCDCENPLNDISHKVQIYLSQDFNDIGHYDLWDGNMSQRDLFSNFTISADSSGYNVILTNTMNYSYYDELAPFTYTIDWGDTLSDTLNSNTPSITHPYMAVPSQRTIKLVQDSPWGPMTSSKLITLPLNSYAGMVGQAYVQGNASNPGTGIDPGGINISGMAGNTPAGSSAYHGRYPDFPLDSATDIDQFSGMSYTGLDCYIVTGVTESVLGNFQSYTNNSDTNLPAGYLEGVWVPIGGDVVNPLNNTFQTGMYGVITTATTTYTAYTVSSSFGATTNNADGDTPITFYDMSNGITIFEADSCGLDKRAFGALACIECPEDDCHWCMLKDEYYDRVDQINIQIPTIINRNTWIPHPVNDYLFGDMVYDETWNSCCCFIAVKDITASDPWYGKSPSISNEGKFLDDNGNEVHVWEACSYDCVSCGLGTQTPCNDNTNPNYTGEVYGVNTITFTSGQYAEDEHGNCYEAQNSGALAHPTGSTYDWDYVGCVSWICPTDPAGTECEMISGPQQGGVYGEMTWQGCEDNLNSANGCFPPQYACPNLYDCVGCVQINAVGPNSNLYGGPSAFNSMSQCVEYCNPLAWSCATPTGSNCCFELSCDNTQPLYLATVGTNLVPTYPTSTPATNGELISFKNTYEIYVGPLYDVGDCQEDCCVNTSWSWSCGEEACTLIGGPPNGINAFATSGDCETYTLTLSQYSGQNATNLEDIICGWTCLTQDIDCVYLPCEPCYWDGCGWTTEEGCNTYCGANTTCGCWRCYCDQGYSVDGGNCTYYNPCVAPPGETWVSYVAGYPGTPGPNPAYNTYINESLCLESCECDVGWDCFLNSTGGTIGHCMNPGSVAVMDGLGYSFSDGTLGFTGYTTFEECCDNTGCCFGDCIETETDGITPYTLDADEQIYYNTLGGILGTNTPLSPYGPTTTFPCVWSPYEFPFPNAPQPAIPPGPCNDPSAPGYVYISYIPWCNIDDCVQYNLVNDIYGNQVCMEPPGECDCACGYHPDFIESTGGWNGSNLFGYDLGYAVSWADADTQECCFICTCPSTGTDWTVMANVTMAIGNQSMQDCNLHEPDLDPSIQGLGNVVNCWESCNKQPQSPPDPSNPTNCDACGSVVAYYECTPGGCVTSSCNNPSDPLCYTTSNCDGMCDTSCFCNGFNNTNCVDTCIMAETVNLNPFLFNFLNTCGPFVYNPQTLTDCNADLLSGALDCCGDTEQWYCDGGENCSALNLLQVSANIPNGLGCVRVYPSDPQWETTLNYNFLTQVECQEECRWECDPSGNQTCTFIGYAPLIGSYPSAFSCYLATTDCDCSNASTEWWCYDDQDPFSTNGGCITNIGGLTSTQQQGLYGQGQVTYISNPSAAFTSLASCEDKCRFCCDESGTNGGYCEHLWGGIGCCLSCSDYPSELDCSLNQTTYPCVIGVGSDWFCDLTLGCTQFPSSIAPGSGPSGTGDGWPLLTNCQLNCAFDCGEDCECEVTLTPNYGGGNPLNGIGAPWPQITGCIVATANGDKCCDCVNCADNSVLYITSWDPPTSSWIQTPYTAQNLINPPLQWDAVNPNINPYTGVQYTIPDHGVVVMFDGCCYIFLDAHSSYAQFAVTPAQNYNNYINNLASSNPADWPVLGTSGNNCLWWPCDPDCVTLSGNPATTEWYCDANITTDTSNCVENGSWGAVSSVYLDNVYGVSKVSHNNGGVAFSSYLDCSNYCRFCCVETIGPTTCQQCCATKSIGGFYIDTTWPCKCKPGDTPVPMASCKGLPGPGNGHSALLAGPISDKYIKQTSDSYLKAYDGETGNNTILDDITTRLNNAIDVGDKDTIKLLEQELATLQIYDPTNPTNPGPTGPTNPCGPPPPQKCLTGEYWSYVTCRCEKYSSNSTWDCELCWGDVSALSTMYSCNTLTAPCGVDPCSICTVNNMYYTTDDHMGFYNPTNVQGWGGLLGNPSYNGIWSQGMTTTAYSHLYVTDPIDGCCYYQGNDWVVGGGPPTGPWLYEPSVCYANHILGLLCDGSSNYMGNAIGLVQEIFPLWWPCDTDCPATKPCDFCDYNTPLWDVSIQYNAGDKVLWPCVNPGGSVGPVMANPLGLGTGQLYCCWEACNSLNCQSPPTMGQEPGVGSCEYWELLCGCDDRCDGSCDPVVPASSWQCPGGGNGCYYLPGTAGYSTEAACLLDCNQFLCSSDSYFNGVSKCNSAIGSTVVAYVDGQGNTKPVNDPKSFINAFITGWGNGVGQIIFEDTTTLTAAYNFNPFNYTYINTEPPAYPGQWQGCPHTLTHSTYNWSGHRSTVDFGPAIFGWGGGNWGNIIGATSWNMIISNLASLYNIDIGGCYATADDFACAQNIVLDPSHPDNNSGVAFTMMEPGRRSCHCSHSSLDCQCLLIPGTGATGTYAANNYTGCLDNCCQGLCADCVANLSNNNYILPNTTLTHLGLQAFNNGSMGGVTFGYSITECVTDPITDCCLCCVSNGTSITTPHTINGIQAACHLELDAPNVVANSITLYDGSSVGTGMWVHCGVAENNSPFGAGSQACPTGPA